MLDKKQEKEYFDKLYEYVKSILRYDESQALPQWFVLRLKGLATGKYLANNHIKSRANYSNFAVGKLSMLFQMLLFQMKSTS